jgi:hypothetical protein
VSDGLQRAASARADQLQSEYQRGFAAGVKHTNPMAQTAANRRWKQWAKDRVDNDEDYLSAWEITFFGSFAVGRYATPSEKQRAVFEKIAARLDLELPE